MRIPRYIDELLDKRARYANAFLEADAKVSDWIEKNGIDVPAEDYEAGARSLFEAEDSAVTIRRCILSHESKNSRKE